MHTRSAFQDKARDTLADHAKYSLTQLALHGKMIVSNRYKYMLYNKGKNREQLIDICNDPGETKNCIEDPMYIEVSKKYRNLFIDYNKKTKRY